MSCGLCGFETALETCRGCAVNASCAVLRCPRCGYATVAESSVVRFVRRWWERLSATPEAVASGPAPLSAIPTGREARILALDPSANGRLDRLAALGLVPGTVVRVVQRSPAYVIAVDETLIAADDLSLAGITVELVPPVAPPAPVCRHSG